MGNIIDNFKQIEKHLGFDSPNDFYFIQIIQRKKEVPELGSNNRLIRSYYINSVESFNKYKDEIVKLCEVFNARAYIHLSPRNNKTMFSDMFTQMGEVLRSNQYDSLSKMFNTVCGRSKGSKSRWVIDVDTKDAEFVTGVVNTINEISNKDRGIHVVIDIIETKNGYHIITEGFNLSKFKEIFTDIEVHKNNPTILYCK